MGLPGQLGQIQIYSAEGPLKDRLVCASPASLACARHYQSAAVQQTFTTQCITWATVDFGLILLIFQKSRQRAAVPFAMNRHVPGPRVLGKRPGNQDCHESRTFRSPSICASDQMRPSVTRAAI
jgi:hypothetical protein